jgi:hypothetical protein
VHCPRTASCQDRAIHFCSIGIHDGHCIVLSVSDEEQSAIGLEAKVPRGNGDGKINDWDSVGRPDDAECKFAVVGSDHLPSIGSKLQRAKLFVAAQAAYERLRWIRHDGNASPFERRGEVSLVRGDIERNWRRRECNAEIRLVAPKRKAH